MVTCGGFTHITISVRDTTLASIAPQTVFLQTGKVFFVSLLAKSDLKMVLAARSETKGGGERVQSERESTPVM